MNGYLITKKKEKVKLMKNKKFWQIFCTKMVQVEHYNIKNSTVYENNCNVHEQVTS